jgi:hypothetical protein
MKIFFTFILIVTISYSSHSQNLLFKSGFEPEVVLLPPFTVSGDRWYQLFSGQDQGFPWPSSLSTGYWDYKVIDTADLFTYVENYLDTIPDNSGNKTHALFMLLKDYDKTKFGGQMPGNVRLEYRLNLGSSQNQGYIKYWLKFQPDLNDVMPLGTERWRIIMQWFENPIAYDWGLSIRTTQSSTDSTSRYWRLFGEFVDSNNVFTTDWVENKPGPVPVGKWFQLEVFWKQATDSSGRICVAIDGNTLFDHRGANMVSSFNKNWQIFKNYNSGASIEDGYCYQWIDDVEIWDNFPDSTTTAVDDSFSNTLSEEIVFPYPNPSHNVVQFKLNKPFPDLYNIKIYNVIGQLVWEAINISSDVKIFTKNWAEGIYIYRILGNVSRKLFTGKILKLR